ncbi:MAG: class E sortase [Microthrixaceae bacterium]
MPQLFATAAIVVVVAALSVYGPMARGTVAVGPTALTPVPLPTSGNDPFTKVVDVLRTRTWARMLITTLSIGLLVGAVGTVGYPFYTNMLQDRIQSRLDRQISSPALRQAYLSRSIGEGDSLTRIVMPDIEVDVVVVEGTTASALRAGAGHYPDTPLPCEIGNVAIAGHRTTYGRPFHNVDRLKVGSEITLETPIGSCTYEVSRDPFVVTPQQTEILANTPDAATLTLTTCHPKGSARQRLVISATLVRTDITTSAAA